MSVFRPAARVEGPDGREWEIYAYKLKVGDRDQPDPFGELGGGSPGAAELAILDGILYLVLLIPRLLLRLVDVAVAAVRTLRSDDWTVEAVNYDPPGERFEWTTTGEWKGQVLAQVEGHLARGDVPLRLTHAVYRGESRSER